MVGPEDDGAALAEELDIQKAILKSWLDLEFDGVEAKREESRREIARVEGMIARHERLRADGGDDARDFETPGPATPSSSMASRQPQQAASVQPTSSLQGASPAFTPRSAVRASPDPFSSPIPSLNRQKRDRESPFVRSSPSAYKAPRLTPTPDSPRLDSLMNGNAVGVPEMIDLTGEDDEVADMMYSTRPAPSTTNAFDKIMASQNPLRRQLDSPAKPQPDSPPPPLPPAMSMPGGYDPSWDLPSRPMGHVMPTSAYLSRATSRPGHLPASYATSRPGQLPATYATSRPGHLPSTTLQPAAHGPRLPFSASPSMQAPTLPPMGENPYQGYSTAVGRPWSTHQRLVAPLSIPFNPLQIPTAAALARYNPLQSPHAAAFPAFNSPHQPPALPNTFGPNGRSLSATINKTSMYDLANQLDADGNPLNERLSSFLDHAYHDPAVTEKELDELLQNIRPDMDIPDKHRDGTPVGLKQPLYHHQELALTWMKQMEEGTNKGGILADDMGLGKTISTVALILERPSTTRAKTTLIIGPLSLVRQWEEEIARKTKVEHRLSVMVYHNTKAATDDLLLHDVVLTTYGTLAQEYSRLVKFKEENSHRNVDYKDRTLAIKFPLLHPQKAVFYRVVLDEAQCIKNRKTKTAKACHELKAAHRWCLTGTPMMNGVIELFSLVHFLRIKPYSVWESFRQTFGVLCGLKGDPKSMAMNRLRALLKAIMLRRKKDSQIDGKPILNLPAKTERIVYAKLSDDELQFYKQLEEKSRVIFSKYLREGSIGKNYSSILVLLLRLRQACCHPHLNLDLDDAPAKGLADLDESLKTIIKRLKPSTVERIKSTDAFECPICLDAVNSPAFFVPCGHDSCQDCLARLLDEASLANLQAGTESDKAKCPVCRGVFEAKKCFSLEAFREVHMPELVVKKSESDDAEDDDESDDEPESGDDSDSDESDSDADLDALADDVDARGNLRGFVVDDDDEDEDDNDDSDDDTKEDMKPKMDAKDEKSRKRKKSKKNKKKKSQKFKLTSSSSPPAASKIKPSMLKGLRKEAAKNMDAHRRYMSYLRKTWLPAAKVTECMTLLKQFQSRGEKAIVFSQWTLLLDLLQVAMHHDKFTHKPERYDGSMSGEERARVARNFRDRPNSRVMLVSLRAGNAGLNLTSANNVIIMDPFWNPYIEMQAVDRAHRIGQKREVNVYRILTRDTVEDRIIDLQGKKKAIVEAALDESESLKIGRLNVSELKFLFNSRD